LIVASFALSGIEMTEENELMAGRMTSGELTLELVLSALSQHHGVPFRNE